MDDNPSRALVLGGGGATGNAWLIGLLAGLHEAGVDLTSTDLTIGTSAGSTAAAQLAGAEPGELYAAALEPVPAPPSRGGAPLGSDHLARLRATIASADGPADYRRTVGAAAIARAEASDGSFQERWRTIVASRLPGTDWPSRRLLVTAVDAGSGEPVSFDQDSGVGLVDAVAASCSGGGMPYRIGDRWFVDGGYRANAENADLARGHARVLVLSPLGGRSLHPVEWGTHLAAQVDALRASGSEVEVVVPDADSARLFGANAMDVTLRPLAARAGHEVGRTVVDRVRALWSPAGSSG